MAYILEKRQFDGKSDAPDRSWDRKDGTYYCLSKDKDKLPTYEDMPSGTVAICVDTREAAFYDRSTRTWLW